MRFWDELSLPWQTCMDKAWEAYCDDCFPIGAAVADAEGQILTTGRNRIYEKHKRATHLRGAELEHAEVEALRALNFDSIDPHTCVLYTTTEPCPMCMGAFYMSGLRTLHFASRDPYAGSSNLLDTTWYMKKKPIKVLPLENRLLELIIMALFIEQDFRTHDGELPEFLDEFYSRMMNVVPECVPAGKTLYESGVVHQARAGGASTANMLDLVVERLSA
jgi:tRNA(adenine34) deaminase